MNPEIAGAHADTLSDWGRQWGQQGGAVGEQMTVLLDRAARLARGFALNEVVELEPIIVSDPAIEEPRGG